jgi:hypothetical protein
MLDEEPLAGPATLIAAWIYCTVTYGFVFGFFLGWIPALILALLVAVAMIYLWPLAAIAILYLFYRALGTYPKLLVYIAALIGIFTIRNSLVVAWFGTDSLLLAQSGIALIDVRFWG